MQYSIHLKIYLVCLTRDFMSILYLNQRSNKHSFAEMGGRWLVSVRYIVMLFLLFLILAWVQTCNLLSLFLLQEILKLGPLATIFSVVKMPHRGKRRIHKAPQTKSWHLRLKMIQTSLSAVASISYTPPTWLRVHGKFIVTCRSDIIGQKYCPFFANHTSAKLIAIQKSSLQTRHGLHESGG